jgi:MoaA/NifB/PqqE/SkfB family radical SAM enzyme
MNPQATALNFNLKGYQAARPPEDRGTFCHAPSLNLNFEQNGNVTACCYNRRHVLGSWPSDSIDSIWKGPKARELRSALAKGDLSKGCDICLEQFEAGNYPGMRSRHFDGYSLRRRAGARRRTAAFPKILEFELSNACNLECEMCNGYFSSAIRKRREKLPPLPRRYDAKFVEELRPYLPRVEWARFLGGEPFLNPLYFEIWEILAETNPRAQIAITTNGTILDERVKKVVRRGKPDIIVSIDSLEKASYESIRKGADFGQMRANLEWFMQASRENGRQMSIVACPMRSNWRDLPKLVAFCSFQGVLAAFNTVLWPVELSLRTLPRAELDEIHAYLSSQLAHGALSGGWAASGVSGANLKSYQGLIRQVDAWRQAG